MKYRSNSHQKFSSEKLQNNNIPQYKSNYNIPNEEIKQSSFESNLLNDVDSNINILLSNLKNNNSPKRKIYFPLNSKTKSPIKVPSTNDITELNLIDEFNSLVENNSYRVIIIYIKIILHIKIIYLVIIHILIQIKI